MAYQLVLNTIVRPLTYCEEDALQAWVIKLKQGDREGRAVGEMLERALRYITTMVALAQERGEEAI